MEMKTLSKCCNVEARRSGGIEIGSTYWYVCTKCNHTCDIINK